MLEERCGGDPGASMEETEGAYEVYALCFARLDRTVRDNFIISEIHDGRMPLDYYIWILHNEARTIVVDTGFSKRAAIDRNRTMRIDPMDALTRMGFDPVSIQHVILTHLHYDHAGNIEKFPNARFYIQDAEIAYATGRCMCEKYLRSPYDVVDVGNLLRHIYDDRVTFHDGDASLFPGVSVHLLPGHTSGIQAVKVKTARGPVVLASDVTHYYAHMVRGTPFVLNVNAAEMLSSFKRLLSLAGSVEHIIPGHDPEIQRLYPKVSLNGIEVHELHQPPLPHDYAGIVANSK